MASSVLALEPFSGCRPLQPAASIAPKSPSSLRFRKSQPVKFKCDYSCFEVRDVSYQPPGTELSLLNAVSFSLPEKSFGLIFGRSGSGKTTLVQLLAGLNKPTSGSIQIQKYGNDGKPIRSPESLSTGRVGIVFQFPERYFVADNVLDEVTFGWPRQKGDLQMKENLARNLHRAINWVGLSGISLDRDPYSLSGGYKRRLALAIQLVQIPDLLILDEPLAGLDDLKFVASQFRRLHSKQLRHTFRFYSQQWRTWAACFIQAAWRRYSKKKLEESLREEENRLQDALAKAETSSPSLGATIYASRFAANVLRAVRLRRSGTRKGRVPERIPPMLLQKPAEPDFTAEEQ